MEEDEVSLAWEALKKKIKKENVERTAGSSKEDAGENLETEKENLEETLNPSEEKFEFKSILPEKAPSLEFSENLEETVNFAPQEEEKKEEKKEGFDYSTKPSYTTARDDDNERESPIVSLRQFAQAPQVFERVEMTESSKRSVGMPVLHHESIDEELFKYVESKQLSHEKLDRERTEKVRKYKMVR